MMNRGLPEDESSGVAREIVHMKQGSRGGGGFIAELLSEGRWYFLSHESVFTCERVRVSC